jgi:hypothetical protein
MVAKHAPPHIAPPIAPTAADEAKGIVWMCASVFEPMRNRVWPSRVRQRFTKEHAGTDEMRHVMVHNEDELMRSVSVTPDQVDSASSAERAAGCGVLWVTESMDDSKMSL